MRAIDSKPVLLLWAALTLGLPTMLLYSAARTYSALESQKSVYLRSRMAAVAAQLERVPEAELAGGVAAALEDEPGLLDVQIVQRPQQLDGDSLAALWRGEELFRTEPARLNGRDVFRAFVPFHGAGGLLLARIDLDAGSADFLVEHARHHLWIVAAGAVVFIALSCLSAWTVRRLVRARQRQSELEHLAHIGRLSAVLAHEIRNPLGTIKGFAQLLAERASDAQQPLIEPIVSETVRLEGLVKELLLYGRPLQAQPAPVCSSEVASRMAAHAAQLPVPVESRVAEFTFSSDINLLEQALLNLLRNAAEAVQGQAGARVELAAACEGPEVCWSVVDNGPGLSPEARRRLFEPFFTSKAFGTGLGLAITRKLAHALGGEFRISDNPAGGTRAELRFPADR